MENLKLFEMLSAGGDLATVAIAFVLIKHGDRLTKIETKIEFFLKKLAE